MINIRANKRITKTYPVITCNKNLIKPMTAHIITITGRRKMYPFGNEVTSHDEVVLSDATISRKNRIKSDKELSVVRNRKPFPLDT